MSNVQPTVRLTTLRKIVYTRKRKKLTWYNHLEILIVKNSSFVLGIVFICNETRHKILVENIPVVHWFTYLFHYGCY